MTRRIKIDFIDTFQLDKRVIDFFKNFDFQLVEPKEDFLKFAQKSSLLDGWKTNPLKWGSEISIMFSDKAIVADFIVDTDAQMNTKEENKVWQTFIEIFKNFLLSGQIENSKLALTISKSKKSRLNCFGWAILGALIGGLFLFIYTNLINSNSSLTFLIIPIMMTIFLKWRIQFIKSKNII